MELPKFKYSPNAYKLDIFAEEDGVCSICEEKRDLKYDSSFYSVDEPEYICPWCIANGKASEKYDGEFNDYCGIEGVIGLMNLGYNMRRYVYLSRFTG